MTKEKAQEFITKYPNARNYVKPSHLEELSPLLEVAIESILCKKEEFHLLAGNTYMPRKETIDRFALAAGVSYNPLEEATRKEGDCYIGRSQAMIMGPDGKYTFGDVCEYEFDVEVRHEEEVIADRSAKYPKYHANGKLLEDKARLAYLTLRKVARQRANTGSRSRATLSILGMQTGFKDLFRPDDSPIATVCFLFSRIIVNTKNQMVLGIMLKNIAAPAAMLYGPGQQRGLRLLEADPSASGELLDEEPPLDDEDAFTLDPDPPMETIAEGLAIQIQELLDENSLGPRAQAAARDAIERHRDDEAFLAELLPRLKLARDRTTASRGLAA